MTLEVVLSGKKIIKKIMQGGGWGGNPKYKIEFRVVLTPGGGVLQEFLLFPTGIGWPFA